MLNSPTVLDDQTLAKLLGLSPSQFAGLPWFVRVFCAEFLAVAE
jgi:hypothetical protein